MSQFFINGKFLNQNVSGVQRYAHGILKYFELDQTAKPQIKSFLLQMLWEQVQLPRQLKKAGSPLLLNFCNTAPFYYENQIVTIHDMAVFENPIWFSKPFAAYYKFMLPRIAQNSKHIVTVSAFSKSEILKHLKVPSDKISVIYPGLNEDLTARISKKPTAINSKFILLVGSHDPRKNFDFAIKHSIEILEANDLQLVHVGRTSKVFSNPNRIYRKDIIELPNTSDQELKWLYENAEVLVQPSIYEGFSLVPMEARSLGCPVLASDIPVHREVLGDDVQYFQVNNPESFKTSLEKLLSVNKPLTKAKWNYDFKASAEKWKELISRFA